MGPSHPLAGLYNRLPAIVVSSMLMTLPGAWNELLFALTFTLSDETRTVPVAIALLGGNSEFATSPNFFTSTTAPYYSRQRKSPKPDGSQVQPA